ncbi:glycoside hydrolase family 18 protein [Cadophora sp. DSE1049]|nr:glycoside hydrolase family 18 protein [Cadophora sp. DSE1049]
MSRIPETEHCPQHFAFATISPSFDVSFGNLTSEFADFKSLTGVKRIVSFGGWSFSTDYDTFPIFRQGVITAQRQALATKVAAFIASNGLDEVDFDWEYPGAPDIPGIPPGSPQDGSNYLAFLQLVRAALPSDKVSVVDYIVYMTYDMHGQWDFGNAWSDDGCLGGNCLRSHINKTETASALAMITHAGVQASKIIVGMALYGRSFQMSTPGCYGESCNFVGKASGATPGKCTGTAGYISNFEIRDLIETVGNAQQYSSDEGDILVYNSVQWISWMTKDKYDGRVSWVKGLNFGGTVDWAIDLDADYDPSDGPGHGDSGSQFVYISPDIYTQANPVIQCYPPCTLILPPFVLSSATTITMEPVTITYKDTLASTLSRSGVVMTTSAGSTTSTVITLPPITTQTIYVSNVVWDPPPLVAKPTIIVTTGSDGILTTRTTTVSVKATSTSSSTGAALIWLTSSIIPPPILITQSQTRSAGPPIIWTYSSGPYPTPPSKGPLPPPPPPPSPRPGFPRSVSIKLGSPKPICRPGQTCGIPCLLICGSGPGCIICDCIGPFCPAGNCVGAGCTDTGGAPGSNPDDHTCRERKTASYCDVECSVIKYPSSSTTTCNNPDCTRTITACTATDSTTTTTTTLACPIPTEYVYGSPDDQVPFIGDGDLGGVVVDAGDFDVPTTTITVSVPGSTTTVNVIATPAAICEILYVPSRFQIAILLNPPLVFRLVRGGLIRRTISEAC